MPLMTRIRESMTKIFAVFAGVFVVYIVLDWGMDLGGTKSARMAADAQIIGYVDDEGIQVREFNDLVQQNLDAQRAQTGADPDEFQVRMVRDQVWNNLVTQRLYDREIERLGLGVSDQEIVDVVKGDNPPDFLRTQFTDSTGTFNRQAYDTAINDPRNRQIMVTLERAIRQQALRSKLQSVVLAGVSVTEGEIAQKFADDNVNYQVEYVAIEPAQVAPDSLITVTDAELREYYDRNITDYKVEATRRVKYVAFTFGPSRNDSEYVRQELEDILRRVGEGASFEEIAGTLTESPAREVTFRRGELEPEAEKAVFDAAAGSIVGPVPQADGYHLIKVHEFTRGKEDYIHAQHVLIRPEGADSAAALGKAREVLAKARAGEDFGGLAATYSGEPGASERKGDLGWFGKGRMVKPFEDAAFSAKVGQIVGPVRTDFGYHVIKILARDSREVKVSDIRMPVEMSPKTQGDVYQKAQDFAYFAKENGLEKEAGTNGFEVAETPAFTREGSIGGLGSFRAINRFAFEGKPGDVSDAMTINNGYAVCSISETKDAGIKPFDEVRTGIESAVRREKRTERAVEAARELLKALKPGDSLGTIAAGSRFARVERFDDLKLGSSTSRVARDPAFSGALEALAPGQVSTPVAGQRQVYVIRLIGKSAFDSSAYSIQRGTILAQMLQQKRERFFNEWTEKLKESVEIVDKRDLFFR